MRPSLGSEHPYQPHLLHHHHQHQHHPPQSVHQSTLAQAAATTAPTSDQDNSPRRGPLLAASSLIYQQHPLPSGGGNTPHWGRQIVSEVTSSCASQSTSSYYTPRFTGADCPSSASSTTVLAPRVGGRPAAIPPPVTYNSPLSQQASPGSSALGYITRRVMATPRARVAPQAYIPSAQSPQYNIHANGDLSPSMRSNQHVTAAPSPGRSSSPAFRHQTLIYRPPPLSARRAIDPVSSSQSRLTDSSFSPPLRFLPYDRSGLRQFESFHLTSTGNHHPVPPESWIHGVNSSDYGPNNVYGTGGGGSAAAAQFAGDRKKKRTRVVAPDLTGGNNSAATAAAASSSRRSPVTTQGGTPYVDAPSSSATTTESNLSPRRFLYTSQTPRVVANHPSNHQHSSKAESNIATDHRGIAADPTWGPHGRNTLDSTTSAMQGGELTARGEPGLPWLETPRLGAGSGNISNNNSTSIPRLPLRQLNDWSSSSSSRDHTMPHEQRSQPVMGPSSLNRSILGSAGGGFQALGTARTSAPRQQQQIVSMNHSAARFAQPTTSRPALSSRVHLQTAGGRHELSLRPIPHKRVVAAGTVSASTRAYGTSRHGVPAEVNGTSSGAISSSSQPLSKPATSVYPADMVLARNNRKRETAMSSTTRQTPLSARPTLAAASCTRTIGSVSSRGGLTSTSGCLTARPATQENRRYICNEIYGNNQDLIQQRPMRSTTQQKQPRTAMSIMGLAGSTRMQPSSSLSQTSTANDSQSSTKLDGTLLNGAGDPDSRYLNKRASLNSTKERLRASLISRHPLRASLRDVPSLASFETIAMIGQGGYAVVRVVRHKASNQIFALKQVAKVDFTSVAQLRMAFTEVDILCAQERLSRRQSVSGRSGSRSRKSLTSTGGSGATSEAERRQHITEYVRDQGHKYFPKFYSCWQDEHFIFFLMEYLPGGDLMKHLIDREIFSEPVAKFYTAQIAVATGYMHDHLLYVHRDIKPDNVLFDTNGHTKLVDFGLSRVLPYRLGTPTRPKFTEAFQSAVGTPDYMAPEVHRPGVPHDRTIDWWSLGIILYEMLFGGPPLSDLHHRPEVTSQLIRNWKSFLTSWPKTPPVSNAAKDLLSKLIAEKEDRLKTVEDVLSHPWFSDLNIDELRTMRAPIVPKTFGPTDVRNFDSFTPSKLIQWEDKKMRGVLPAEVAAILMEARKSPIPGDPHNRSDGPHIPYVPSRPSTNRSSGEPANEGGRPTTTDPIMAKTLFQSSASTTFRSRNSLSQTTAPKTVPNRTSPAEEEAARSKVLHRTPPQRPMVATAAVTAESSRRIQALESISRSSGGGGRRMLEGPSLESVNRCRTETVLHQRRMEPSSLADAAVLLQHLNTKGQQYGPQSNNGSGGGGENQAPRKSSLQQQQSQNATPYVKKGGDEENIRRSSRSLLKSCDTNSLSSSSDPSATMSNSNSNHPCDTSSNQEAAPPSNHARPNATGSNHTSKLASQVASAGTDLYPPSTSDITSSAGDKQQLPGHSGTLLSDLKTKVTRWLTSSSSSSSTSNIVAAAAVLQVDPRRLNASHSVGDAGAPFHSLKQAAGVQCESSSSRSTQHEGSTFPLQHKMRTLATAKE